MKSSDLLILAGWVLLAPHLPSKLGKSIGGIFMVFGFLGFALELTK